MNHKVELSNSIDSCKYRDSTRVLRKFTCYRIPSNCACTLHVCKHVKTLSEMASSSASVDTTNATELLPPIESTSKVWEHFYFLVNKFLPNVYILA